MLIIFLKNQGKLIDEPAGASVMTIDYVHSMYCRGRSTNIYHTKISRYKFNG